MLRPLQLAGLALLAASVVLLPGAGRALAQSGFSQAPGVQVPAIPDPVAVSLDATTTAFLVLDFVPSTCNDTRRPACVASLPLVSGAIAAARAANVLVIYSGARDQILESVAPQPDDPLVVSSADKFFNTNLDDILKQHGITTVVITGTASNGAGLYTSFGAAVRGYTVVVLADGISGDTDFATLFTEWQLLTAPGTANPQNTPLQPKAVTLSRTDLITYK